MMGYLWRVRLSSFVVGAATASVTGLCLLYRDYVIAHDSISSQVSLSLALSLSLSLILSELISFCFQLAGAYIFHFNWKPSDELMIWDSLAM